MQNISVAIAGYGNIGRFALDAILAEKDMELKGVVRRSVSSGDLPPELREIPVVTDVRELGKIDVILLCVPTRSIREEATRYLRQGICTVDSFDIHGPQMWELKNDLDQIAKNNHCSSVISAGWDPGSDSLIRAVMTLMVPRGITHTNFGPGMSMGHSVVAKGIEGVEDAVSLTIPLDTGLHRRLVYIKLKPEADFETIQKTIKNDAYFSKNETHVFVADDLDAIKDMGHGVRIAHKGKAGLTHNQLLEYCHRINNPAVTSQVMVSAARAVVKQSPGCYTMLEIPLVDYLNIPLEKIVKTMI